MGKIKRLLTLIIGVTLIVCSLVGCGEKKDEVKVVKKAESADVVIKKTTDWLKGVKTGSVNIVVNNDKDTANADFSFDATKGFNAKLSATSNVKDSKSNKLDIYVETTENNILAYADFGTGYSKVTIPLAWIKAYLDEATKGVVSGGAVTVDTVSNKLLSNIDYKNIDVKYNNGIYTLTGTYEYNNDVLSSPNATQTTSDRGTSAESPSATQTPDKETLDGAIPTGSPSDTQASTEVDHKINYTVTIDSNKGYRINSITFDTDLPSNQITQGGKTSLKIDTSKLGTKVDITVPDTVKSTAKEVNLMSLFENMDTGVIK